MGGGTIPVYRSLLADRGLSPRGRGNLILSDYEDFLGGSIPAWAGEPRRPVFSGGFGWVYPRVGGGTRIFPAGVYRSQGLSPRGRGNRGDAAGNRRKPGSIPAWAGEPACLAKGSDLTGVYPRVGGGTDNASFRVAQMMGLSPRGRGNPGRRQKGER